MTHQEVKFLQQELIILINHLIENKCKNYHVNYGLDRNYDILTIAVKVIDKNVSKELIELEEKAMTLAKEQEGDKLTIGFSLLSKEEQEKHEELFNAYKEFMKEENDVKLYYLDPLKNETVEIEWIYYQILKKFLKNEL